VSLKGAETMLKTEIQSTALLSEPDIRPTTSFNLTEIAGYRLQERIGMGGFGEVWKAIGPGGFPKAVKILFGNLSGPQAETELRALNRIRDLRHPFLLSIERVEVIDGRVVIVTELADRSLDDRFKEIVASGQKGIPREELIGYLRDAADALDFMSDQHELQHLDVKPDNLLLQGSHAKVGDFGLTKSLAAGSHSLVNGFTPLYTPPELFDGRPERGSDQYSLAIVYQTMLTGVPPFNGRSAAQLTSQHLKSAPDLSTLHPSDRAMVARALSKNPRTRFPSCRQFIDELSRRRYASSSLPKAAETAEPAATSSLKHFVESGTAGISTSQLMPSATPLRPPGTEGLTWLVRPTMFVAIGGMGAQVVSQFRERLQHRFSDAPLPAIHFLCVDADLETTQHMERDAASTSATSLATIGIPLRTSHEYRKSPRDHLNWLSRRWLFNIPRSGKVEGMRPLGRLAFVDHQEQIRNQLQKGIDQIFHGDAARASSEQTQLPFTRDGLDFVIVGSTSGGTCSGSLLDAAALLRSLLSEKKGLTPCSVTALLMHGTGNSAPLADMQDANTVSFLKELNHFSLPGVQCSVAQNRTGNTSGTAMPLDEVVLVHLGDDLSNVNFQTGIASVTDYLELRTLTPARLEMDSWRIAADNDAESKASFSLKTFGIARVAYDTWDVANSEASMLASAIIQRWTNAKAAVDGSGSSSLSIGLMALMQDLSLTGDAVIDLVPRLLNAERTRRVDDYASAIWSRLGSASAVEEVPGLVASLISQETSSTVQKSAIAAVIEEIRKDLTAGVSRSLTKIVGYVHSCIESRGRISAAQQAVQEILVQIDEAAAASVRQKSDLQSAFADLCSSFSNQAASPSDTVDGNTLKVFCRQYCMLLVCQTVCQNVTAQLKNLRESTAKLHDEQMPLLKKRLQSLSSLIETRSSEPSAFPAPMVNAFEEFLLKSTRFRVSQLIQKDASSREAAALSGEAANFLFQSFGKTSGEIPVIATATTSAFPATARPFLRNVGGGQRVLAAVPEQIPAEPWRAQIQSEFGACVSVCPMDRKDITVVCEVEGITIPAVMDTLSNLKPKVIELAGRVHSRQDIQW